MSGFIELHSTKRLLCTKCAKEMSRLAARFHRLRCKPAIVTGVITYDPQTGEHDGPR